MMPARVAGELRRLAELVGPVGQGRDWIRIGPTRLPNDATTADVAQAVYEQWFLTPAATRPVRPFGRDIVPLLRAAHAEARRFEPGWVVMATLGRGACLVVKGEVRRVALPGEYAAVDVGAAPVAPGQTVSVCARMDGLDRDSGYWVTRSASGEPEGPLSRFYFHLPAHAAPAVVHALTARLAEMGTPWSLKCHSDPAGYRRVDGLVAYVSVAVQEPVRSAVRAAVVDIGHLLDPPVPPLTERLAPGAAYADDPGGGISFGQHRAQSLAPAVVQVAAEGLHGLEAVRTLTHALVAAGIDPDRPWRHPSSNGAAA